MWFAIARAAEVTPLWEQSYEHPIEQIHALPHGLVGVSVRPEGGELPSVHVLDGATGRELATGRAAVAAGEELFLIDTREVIGLGERGVSSWSAPLPGDLVAAEANGSGIVIWVRRDERRVVIGLGKTGETEWRVDLPPGEGHAAVLPLPGAVLVADSGSVSAWERSPDGAPVRWREALPAEEGARFYLLPRGLYVSAGSTLAAIDPTEGLLWRADGPGPVEGVAESADNTLIAAFRGDKELVLQRLSASGGIDWQIALEGRLAPKRAHAVRGIVALPDVLVASAGGDLFGLHLDGSEAFRIKLDKESALQAHTLSRWGQSAILLAGNGVSAYNGDGEQLWATEDYYGPFDWLQKLNPGVGSALVPLARAQTAVMAASAQFQRDVASIDYAWATDGATLAITAETQAEMGASAARMELVGAILEAGLAGAQLGVAVNAALAAHIDTAHHGAIPGGDLLLENTLDRKGIEICSEIELWTLDLDTGSRGRVAVPEVRPGCFPAPAVDWDDGRLYLGQHRVGARCGGKVRDIRAFPLE